MSYSRLELNGKILVVIGGTSGIGQAIARGLASFVTGEVLVVDGGLLASGVNQ